MAAINTAMLSKFLSDRMLLMIILILEDSLEREIIKSNKNMKERSNKILDKGFSNRFKMYLENSKKKKNK